MSCSGSVAFCRRCLLMLYCYDHKIGNIIQISLSLSNHTKPYVSFSEEQLCSTSSGRDEKVVLLPRPEQCFSIKTDTVKLTPEPNKEDAAEIASLTMLYENQMKRAESQCKALIEDWVPSWPLLFEQKDSDDLEWLFGAKQQKRHGCKRLNADDDQERHGCKRVKADDDDDVSCHASATLWPRAQYLPEADIYALPYSIPF